MPLNAGMRLGPYEILSSLGAGGMGEVYRAHDTKLDRDVAIKVLPEAFASDPERLARFEREAKTLAALNHPHIAHVYGLEGTDGVQALVMELVEGPTLADRIAKGPIPLDEVLPIAKQIAEALEAAHERSIIHRDLKPANIKLRLDGTVKVLDFGLAKAMEPTAIGGMDATASPTITSPALMTGVGVLLGTAAYMSPEQAKGRLADKRSDIWAFGCVFYEMLTGKRAFDGEDITETIAAVVKGQPDWSALPAALPPTVRVFLRRCFAKIPADRLHDIGDMRLAIDGAFDVPESATSSAARASAGSLWRSPAVLAAMLTTVAISTVATLWLASSPSERPLAVRRFAISTGESPLWIANNNRDVAITPDGSRIVYFTGTGANRQLQVRALDALEGTAIRDAARAYEPFISPDSRWVGFNDEAGFMLRKMPIVGGPQ